MCSNRWRETERERQRERDSERDKEKETERETHTERETNRETETDFAATTATTSTKNCIRLTKPTTDRKLRQHRSIAASNTRQHSSSDPLGLCLSRNYRTTVSQPQMSDFEVSVHVFAHRPALQVCPSPLEQHWHVHLDLPECE